MKRNNKVYSRKDIVELLESTLNNTNTTKKVFSELEACFFIEPFIEGSSQTVIYALIENIVENGKENVFMMSNANKKRLSFAYHYLATSGNATRAATNAGYSKKTARQAGYRTLKWIQNQLIEAKK